MKYNNNSTTKKKSKIFILISIIAVLVFAIFAGSIATRFWYENQLEPVNASTTVIVFEVPKGASVQQIGDSLEQKKIIKNSQAFQWYVRNNSLTESMKAGTYELDSAKNTPDIVKVITKGDVKEVLFTILPGQRLAQIKSAMIKFGFSEAEVNEALKAENYKNHPALVAKPSNLDLEGYLYPESFNTTTTTNLSDIVEKSLDEMASNVTPELIDAWQKQGLGIHQAITLASIVENEVSEPSERATVAGVFYNRLKIGMKLESDPTYLYGGFLLGQNGNARLDSPYNTYKIPSLPPGPISNVSISSLQAVAYPKSHEYLFFVAGDDGITRFSKTLEEHQQNTAKYCIELCKSY
jgi:UPF0755 protein